MNPSLRMGLIGLGMIMIYASSAYRAVNSGSTEFFFFAKQILRALIGDTQRQGWRSTEYNSLVKQAQRSLDQEERMKLYGEAEHILAQEAPIMPIFHWSTRVLVKPWVTRYPMTGLREWFFKDVIIEPHQS